MLCGGDKSTQQADIVRAALPTQEGEVPAVLTVAATA